MKTQIHSNTKTLIDTHTHTRAYSKLTKTHIQGHIFWHFPHLRIVTYKYASRYILLHNTCPDIYNDTYINIHSLITPESSQFTRIQHTEAHTLCYSRYIKHTNIHKFHDRQMDAYSLTPQIHNIYQHTTRHTWHKLLTKIYNTKISSMSPKCIQSWPTLCDPINYSPP